jgi:eukaryotic-like serine/threonine-protein kinase
MNLAAPTESTRVLAPGARIGRKLEVLRRLGEGGMGTLWVARNLTTEAEVAIKVLRAHREDAPDVHAEERFRHEARLGAMLAHRNITRVFDLIEDEDGALVLVMELLHGETLQAQCEAKGALSSKEAVALMVPILGALQHAHEHNVVHRDIKPANIFLHVDPDGHTTPKLLDFGIAKMHESSLKTQGGHVLGTPSYMSPEQVRASQQIDGRSDIFSVGTVLYEIITGENPFRTDAPSATLARVLELEIDPDPRIEPRLWLEIQRALAKQPYERHASAADFADALCDAVGEAPPRSLRREKPLPRAAEPTIPAAPPLDRETTEQNVEAAAVLPKPMRPARLAAYGAAIGLAFAGVLLLRAATQSKPTAEPAPSAPAAVSLPSASATVMMPSAAVADADVVPAAISSGRYIGELGTGAPPRQPVKRPTVSASASPKTPASAPPKTPASAPSIARTPGF